MGKQRYLRVGQVADRLQVARDTLYRNIRSGRLPANVVAKLGGTIRIDAEAFQRELEAGRLSTRKPRTPQLPTAA